MGRLTNNLIHKGYLKTDIIIDAFSELDRSEFVSERFRVAAASDIPLSIGYGQVLPEPSIIAFMLELLRPDKSQDIMVVGFGGGWVIAMLSYIVGSNGSVYAIDTINELKNEVERNLKKYNFIARSEIATLQVINECQDLDKQKTFDRILVINPDLWSLCNFRDFLRRDGVMVAPIDNIIYYFHNQSINKEMVEERFDGMRFLPI